MIDLSSNGGSATPHPLDEAELRHYLSVPFVAVIYSVASEDGEWSRRAEYPELPGCAVEAASAVEAMKLLEEVRVRVIVDSLARGEKPPEPRPALAGATSGLSSETMQQLLRRVLEGSVGEAWRAPDPT